MTRLLACISSHGYGHFAMTAPILHELNKQPSITLTVRCELPEKLIRSRIGGDFDIVPESSDFGIVMDSSLDVDLEKTAAAYRSLHADFSQAVENEKAKLISYEPDLILANIPYVTIAAAKLAGIPTIAYCSLNWATIFHDYFIDTFPEAESIFLEMKDAYNEAESFICPSPSMLMPGFTKIKKVGPVAKVAANQHEKIKAQLSLPQESKLVLVTPGGVYTDVPINDWPELPGVIWITAWPYQSDRKDVVSIEQVKVPFNELLVSCDAVITKPGYGTVTETTCNGIPVLYVLRGDWPEEPFLESWWIEHGTVLKINRADFFAGNIAQSLTALWALPQTLPVNATGVDDILLMIKPYLKK